MSARHSPRRALAVAVVLPLALGAMTSASQAASNASASRFSLNGTAELSPGTRVQSAGHLNLKASLQAATSHVAQSGGGYTLLAGASPLSLVCTPDTIFMDGFDGG